MARPLRIEYPGAFYHVLNRGLERREIFRSRRDYEVFLTLCLEIHKRFEVRFHAFSLMPNHYHLMVETPDANLSRAMRHLDGVFTQNFNKRHKRVGPLFQGRYKAILIDKDAYSLQLSRYIHLNPMKTKMATRPEGHPYSSLQYYLGHASKPAFLETDWLLGQFHRNLSQARRAFHDFTLKGLKDAWSPDEGLRSGMILGTERFYERIKAKYLEGRQDREIPALRKVRAVPDFEKIKDCIERCGCQEEKIKKRLTLWTLRRHTSLKLKEIAEKLQAQISYSAVSQSCRRLERERTKDKRLHGMMRRIEEEMSNVKT